MRGRKNKLITFILLFSICLMQISECIFAAEISDGIEPVYAEIVEELPNEDVDIEELDTELEDSSESKEVSVDNDNVRAKTDESIVEAPVITEIDELINEDSVSDNELVSEEDDVEIAMLTTDEAGIGDFPESYKEDLTKLWKAHSNWKFERKNIKLDWDKAVSNELVGNRSVISSTAPAEYKGTKWSGSWYYASKAGVEHYLDPRNFLDESSIFMFEKLSYESYQDAELTQIICKDTFMKGNVGGTSTSYASMLTKIGKNAGVSPIHLASRIRQELGAGNKSESDIPIISGSHSSYPGIYNYYNIQATGTGAEAVTNGLKYASGSGDYSRPWNTREKALKGGAEFIYSGYTSRGQDTLYFEKWNVVHEPYYIHQYMQNIQAPATESKTMANGYKSAGKLSKAFVFEIPVYSNMPDAPDTKKNNDDKPSSKEIPLTEIKGLKFAEMPDGVKLKAGETIRLKLNTVPGNLTPEPIINWSISGDSIASVDCDGNITAHEPGTTYVVATSDANKAVSAMCKIVIDGVHIRYRKLDGEILLDRSDAVIGSFISEYPYSEKELFPESKIDVLPNQQISGFYTGQNRSGIRVTENTEITGDMDIYPFLIDMDKGFEVKPVGDIYYTGDAIKPDIEVYNKDILLKKGKDYTVKYAYNKIANADATGKQLGASSLKPTIIVTGKGNYTGSETLNFNIMQSDMSFTDIDDITLVYKKGTKAQYGKPAVYLGGKKLLLNKDYTVSYPVADGNLNKSSDNYGSYIAAGMYPVVIKGMGSMIGEKVIYEYITKKISLSKLKVTKRKLEYGSELSANDIVSSGYIQVYNKDSILRGYIEGSMVEQSTDWDYKVVLPKNMKSPGNKSIKIIGNRRNGYYGTKKVTLATQGGSKIYLSRSENLPGTITISDPNVNNFTYTYVKGGVKPNVKIYLADGKELIEGKDIKISYKNYNIVNVKSEKVPTIIVKGIGIYAGAVNFPYTIEGKDISLLGATANAAEYTGKPGNALAKISVFDENGQLLKAGTDYVKDMAYKDVDTGKVISKYDVVSAGTKISVSINGTGCYSGVTSVVYEVKQMSISKAKAFVKPQVFTGKNVTISQNDITIFNANGTKLTNDDFEILDYSYSRNINKGTANVYIRGKGNYGGTKKISFKITALPIMWYYNK